MPLLLHTLVHSIFGFFQIANPLCYLLREYCRALIEVKPTLFIREDDTDESEDDFDIQDHQTRTTQQDYWGFQDEPWHHSCLQKCIVPGNICAVMLNITCENITKICNDTLVSGHPLSEGHTEKLAKWCIYLIDSVLSENLFSWENAMVS